MYMWVGTGFQLSSAGEQRRVKKLKYAKQTHNRNTNGVLLFFAICSVGMIFILMMYCKRIWCQEDGE